MKTEQSILPVRACTAKHQFLIGIDPGVQTGIALWDRASKSLQKIETVSIIEAQHFLLRQKDQWPHIFLRIEDARQRKWFGNAGREKLQGAGSIKRDCSIWEEFCQFHGIEYELVKPKNNKTKMDADIFKKCTGWKARTSEHARDAAMLVFGY
jgi:hypothetical protein